MEAVPPRPPLGTYVDVGCGNGQATFEFAPFFKDVHGFDISKAMITDAKDEAKRRGPGFEHLKFGYIYIFGILSSIHKLTVYYIRIVIAHNSCVHRISDSATLPGLSSNSVDLLTTVQACHWFDIPAFYDEAERVLKPGGEGILAIIGYGISGPAPNVNNHKEVVKLAEKVIPNTFISLLTQDKNVLRLMKERLLLVIRFRSSFTG